jgi:hypothetical protein
LPQTRFARTGIFLGDPDVLSPLRTTLYRHDEGQFIDKLVDEQSLRLSSLHKWHDTVQFGSEIGDSMEGFSVRDTSIRNAEFDADGQVHGDGRVRELLGMRGRITNSIFRRITYNNIARRSPPTLCYCLSESRSNTEVGRRMSERYDAVATLTIDVDLLVEIKLALRAAGLPVHCVALGRVAYVPSRHIADGSPYWHYMPALLKEAAPYSYQKEGRIMAHCEGAIPTFIDIQIPLRGRVKRLPRRAE